MVFITALALLALPALVVAQYPTETYSETDTSSESYPESTGYGSSTESYTETKTSSGTVSAPANVPSAPPSTPGQINIDVASGQSLTYNPPNITAPNGTVVTFFFPKGIAHSVTQSSFDAPCTYLAASGGNSGGFDSGLTQADQFTIKITNDAEPIWYHCKQSTHCGEGMVGSINAPLTGNTYDAFKAAALAIGASQPPETDNGPVTGGVGGVATATPAATYSPASSPSGTKSSTSPSGNKSSTSSSTSKPSGSSSSASGKGVVASGFWGFVAAIFALALPQV